MLLRVLVCMVCGLVVVRMGPAAASSGHPCFMHFVLLPARFWFGTGMRCCRRGRVLRHQSFIRSAGRSRERYVTVLFGFDTPRGSSECLRMKEVVCFLYRFGPKVRRGPLIATP